MNKIFKVIWNHAAQRFDVVSELTKSNGKSSSTTDNRIEPSKALLAISVVGAALLGSAQVMAATATTPLTDSTGTALTSGGENLYIITDTAVDPSNGNAIGDGIAIGYNATATDSNNTGNALAIGRNSSSTARFSAAIGSDANAAGVYSTAIGFTAQATNTSALAIGDKAIASGELSTAIGCATIASSLQSTAVGTEAVASGNYAFALGSKAVASNVSTVAIGMQSNASGANSTSIGVISKAAAESSIAMGVQAEVTSTGDSAIAIGRTSLATGTRAVALGRTASASGGRSTAVGPGAETVADYGSALGNRAQVRAGATNGVAVGNSTISSADNATALGSAATASHAGAVALGNASITRAATSENTATVGPLTYGGFAGNSPASVVSVGSAGAERQLVNVAAGNISTTSTDAINGSQLYATNDVLGNVYNSTVAAIGGTVTPNAPNTGNFTVSFNLTGTNPSNSTPTEVTYTNIGSALTALSEAVNKPLTFTGNSLKDTDSNGTTQELGSTIAVIGSTTNLTLAENQDAAVTGNYSSKNIQTVVTDNQIQIQMAENPVFNSTIITDGTTTTTIAPTSITVGKSDAVTKPVTITSGANGGTVSNLTTTLEDTGTAGTAPANANTTNAATLGDVLNAGWNLQENAAPKDLVTAYDTVNFVNGTGTTVNITTTNGNLSTVKVDVNVSSLTGNVTNGTTNVNGTTTVAKGDENKLVNTTVLADAINKSGFTLKSSATTDGTQTATSGDEIINPGDVIEMIAGKNMAVTQAAGGKITYATEENVDFDTVTISNGTTAPAVKLVNEAPIAADNNPTATTPTSSLNITNTDGKPTQLTGVGSVLNTVATPNSTGNQGTAPNVTPETTGTVDLVDLGTGTSTTILPDNVLNSAATVRDLANMGWVVSTPNNNFTQAVKNANQVNFIGTGGVDVQGALNATTGIYDVTLKLSPAGSLVLDDINSATPVPGTTNPSGKVEVKDNPAGFVGAQNIADMINGAGWNLLNNDEQKDLVSPGNKVNFVNGLGTLTTIESDGTDSIVQVDVDFGNMSNNANGTINGPITADEAEKLRKDVTDAQEALRLADEALAALPDTATDAEKQAAQAAVDAAEEALLKADNAANDAGLYQVATTQNVAEMINASGWNVTSGAVGSGAVSGTTDELINPGEQVTFRAGNNMVLTQAGNVFTYAVSTDPVFNSTTVGGNGAVTYTNAAGDTLTATTNPDGSVTYTDAQGNVVDPADVITNVANPITIGTVDGKNVISNLTSTLLSTSSFPVTDEKGTVTAQPTAKAPITAQEAAKIAEASGDNAATLGDVLNAGWNLKVNDEDVDFVKPYDTVAFVNGTGTTARVEFKDGVQSNITFDVNVDNKTTKITHVDAAGNTLTKKVDPATGDVTYTDEAGNVVDAADVVSQVSAILPTYNSSTLSTTVNEAGDTVINVNTGEITPEADGSVTGPVTPALTDALKAAEDALAALPDTATEAEKKAAQDAVDAAQTAINNAGSQVATAQNVADAINASGWRTNSTTATGQATETLVNPGEQVNFEAGKNMVVTQDVNATTGTVSYTYATADDVTFNSTTIGGQDTYKDAEGNPVIKNAAGDFVDAAGNKIDPANVTTVNNSPITIGTTPEGNNVIANLTKTLPDTTSVGDKPTEKAPITAEEAQNIADKAGNNAATLGDVLNAGWNLKVNKEDVDFVKPYDTVAFVNGTGTTARVEYKDGIQSNITFDVNVDNTTTEITYADAAGNQVVKVGDKFYNPADLNKDGTPKADAKPVENVVSRISAIGPKVNGETVSGPINIVNGDTTTVTNTPKGVKVEVNTGTSDVNDEGKATVTYTDKDGNPVKATTNPDGSVTYTDKDGKPVAAGDVVSSGDKVATVGDIVNTINNVGWFTNSTTSTEPGTNTKISAGKAVNFEAGKNMEVTQKVENGNVTYTYATKKEVTFDKVTADKGITLGAGDNAVNMTPTTTNVANGDISPAVNMNGATFTNMTSNLPNTTSVGDNPTTKAPLTAQEAQDLANKSGSNAATLGDVLNAGWNLQENGKEKDFVKPYDTVNFVNGVGTTANITTDGSVSNVTYNVNVDNQTTEITYTNKAGDTIYKLADGTYNTSPDGKGTAVAAGDISGSQVSAKTSPLTNNADGTVNTPANPKSLATAGDVANAINNSGFTLTTSNTGGGDVSGTSKEVIKPGKTVTIDAGKNISVTQNAGTITVATKKDVEFDSVKAGPVTINSSGINAGGTRVTNVAPGKDGTDAVNVNQLKQVAGDIHNKINRNNKDLRAGIAGANAAAGLPQVYIPGKSMVAASAGTFKGQSAVAVGYSRASDNGKLILKLQGNANTRGDIGGSVGVILKLQGNANTRGDIGGSVGVGYQW